MSRIEPRRYRILAVLGEGAVGRVYRARLVRSDGFEKEIALKLLTDEVPGRSVLERFRDEARIIALIRDRAVVGVSPPVRLAGRWAVPMDFVDGSSGRHLLETHTTLPAAAAVEIVAEVARALSRGWTQLGPTGEPLQVIHRDIKPGNIQVTPAGEVRLVDFGIAKARFAAREVHTRGQVGGTPGYVAPERMFGLEGPGVDIYALGVVLHEFLTGRRPGPDALPLRPELADLVGQMMDVDPEARPSARDVERRCRLAMRVLPGPTLREWAESSVGPAPELPPDALVGALLEEDFDAALAPVDSGRGPISWMALVALVLCVGTAGLVLGGGVLMRSVGSSRNSKPAVPAPTAADVRSEPPVTPATEAIELRVPAPISEPVTEPVSAATPPPTPHEAPRERSVGAVQEVRITSIPMGATVRIGDQPAGVTPVLVDLSVGEHEVSIQLDDWSGERRLFIGRRAPTRYVWRAEEDRWESGF